MLLFTDYLLLVVSYHGCREYQKEYRNEDVRGEEKVCRKSFFVKESRTQEDVHEYEGKAGQEHSEEIGLISQEIHAAPFVEVDDGGVCQSPDFGDDETEGNEEKEGAQANEQKDGFPVEHTIIIHGN